MKRRNETGQHNQSRVAHQFGNFRDAANIFNAIGVGKAKIFIQALANVVTVQNKCVFAALVQRDFQSVGNRAFPAARKTGEPNHFSRVAVHALAVLASNGQRLLVHILPAAQTVANHSHRDSRVRESIDQNKTAKFARAFVVIKRNGLTG